MAASVPVYPTTVAPSVDKVLEAARRKFPPDDAELAAERAMNEARIAYDDFLKRSSKTVVDLGKYEGSTYGFGYADPKYDAEREEVHDLLTRATVKFHALVRARQARIQRDWEIENAKLATAAQREWQKARGQ